MLIYNDLLYFILLPTEMPPLGSNSSCEIHKADVTFVSD